MKLPPLFLIVFIFTSNFSFSQVTFSHYGAVGDGVTDDRNAIQLALNSESNLKAEPNKTFYISGRLHLNQNFDHIIDWNGAVITSNEPIHKLFQIQKMTTGSHTKMENLTIDGNNSINTATFITSPTTFINVDIKDLVQGSSPVIPIGINVRITDSPNSFGSYLFDGCDITNITGTDDGIIGNSVGGAYHVYVQWETEPTTPTTVTVQNATYNGSWGEDGCLIYLFQINSNEDIGNTLNHNYFKNLTLKNWQRRAVKGFCGGQTWENSTFYNTPDNHSNITNNSSATAGLLEIGRSKSNFSFNECTFIDVEPNQTGRDNRLIFANATGANVKNCSFEKGVRIAFARTIGNVLFCGNNFGEGSYAYDYLETEDQGEIIFDSENTYVEDNFHENINFFSYVESDLTCDQMTASLEDLNALNNIKIFPNPSSDFIEVLLPNSISYKKVYYTIFNSLGQKTLNGFIMESNVIDVTKLKKGVYFIEFQCNEKKFKSKFIKK